MKKKSCEFDCYLFTIINKITRTETTNRNILGFYAFFTSFFLHQKKLRLVRNPPVNRVSVLVISDKQNSSFQDAVDSVTTRGPGKEITPPGLLGRGGGGGGVTFRILWYSRS